MMLITSNSIILRIHVGNIKSTGRDTMGVHLMKLDSGARVSDVARVAIAEEEETL